MHIFAWAALSAAAAAAAAVAAATAAAVAAAGKEHRTLQSLEKKKKSFLNFKENERWGHCSSVDVSLQVCLSDRPFFLRPSLPPPRWCLAPSSPTLWRQLATPLRSFGYEGRRRLSSCLVFLPLPFFSSARVQSTGPGPGAGGTPLLKRPRNVARA